MKTIKVAKPEKGKKRKIIILGVLLIVISSVFGIINSIKPPAAKETAAVQYKLGSPENIENIGTFNIKDVYTIKELRAADGYIFESESKHTLLIVEVELAANEPITFIKQAATNWKPADDNQYTIFPRLEAKYNGVDTSRFAIMADYPDITNIEQLELKEGETRLIMYAINIPKADAYENISFEFNSYNKLVAGEKPVKNGSWEFVAKPNVK